MKHSGKARKAGFKIIFLSLIAVLVVWAILAFAVTAAAVVTAVVITLMTLWIIFAAFTLYFFRDPDPRCPTGVNLVLSPGHGKVDVIDTLSEAQFMGGECQRISMFLSVINVHVQNAPVGGKITFFKYARGQFMSALQTASAEHNENILIGIEANEPAREKIGVRLIAGVLARRIVSFVQAGDEVARGERISLIQFGSRVDVYLPLRAKIRVKLGDHSVGGETVLAVFD